MTASLLLKLFIGITVLLIVCIPERFTTEEDTCVDLSCIGPCLMDIYISRGTDTSLTCFLEENVNSETIETLTEQYALLSSITLSLYVNNSNIFTCDPLSQEVDTKGKLINVSLNVRGKYFHYSDVESNFVKLDSQEDEYLHVPFSLDIHIRNLTGYNKTMDQLHYQDPRDRHDFINVSLRFESQIPFYSRPLGIFWLFLIALVFISGLIFIVYKVKQEKRTAPFMHDNQEISGTLRIKEHKNILLKPVCHKGDHTCKQEGQNVYLGRFLPKIDELRDTVYK